MEVRVFEVNREANTLTLSKQVEGDANEDASPSRKLTASDQLWCVVNTVDEEGVHVDMGWRNGLVRLDHMAWFSIVELLNALFAGCAISAMFYAEDLEGDEATLVVEWPEGDKLPKPRKWWLESEGGGERAAEEAEELDDDEEGGGGARQQLEGEREDEVEGEREDEVEGEREDEVEGEREDEVEGAKEGCGDDGASRS